MNTLKKHTGRRFWLAALLLPMLVTACGGGGSNSNPVPTVTTTSPATAATAVALNSKVTATFSEAMDSSTIDSTNFTVVGASETAITGTVTYDAASKTATFTHASNFTASKVYTATLTKDIRSSLGKAMAANYAWTFTSGTAADSVAPTVISKNPADASTGFALNGNVSANFSEALDPTTVNASTFTLKQGSTTVSGAVSYDNKVVTFNPTDDLIASKPYTATLTMAITDVAANPLAAIVTWSFTTGSAVAAGPDAINLRTAANFAIMTGTGITSADVSPSIIGNIGASGITGLAVKPTCGQVTGEVYTDDAGYADASCVNSDKTAASLALADVLTAYTAASAPATPAAVGASLNIGAGTVITQTLAPGVYTWTSNVSITGQITLDGGATDVWIFQIDGTLDTNQIMTLANGALPENVFWRVANTVTLGSGAQFKGIVLAKTDVAMIDTATITGRLLAQTEVRLGTNTVVTQP